MKSDSESRLCEKETDDVPKGLHLEAGGESLDREGISEIFSDVNEQLIHPDWIELIGEAAWELG